jgi:hypothetical protein
MKTKKTLANGKEKTMETTETKVMARSTGSHWYVCPQGRGGYATVKSLFYPDTPEEDDRMKKDLGAFCDHIADIRVAFQSGKRADGTPIRYATVLAANPDEVQRLLNAFWLGFRCGKDAR